MGDPVGDFVAGTVAGIVSKFVDFPFDTVKVRMQADHCQYKSTIDCIVKTARNEGVRGFYAGVAAPIGGAAFENAFVFASYGRAMSLWKWATGEAEGVNTVQGVVFAGACGGVATATVLTPVELLKCRVQNQRPGEHLYNGVFDCGVKTVKREGVKALYNGHSATLLREIPGNAAWFGFYELSLSTLFIPEGGTRDDCAWYAYPVSGGIGGFWYWTTLFPADVVKTRMQTDPEWLKRGLFRGLAMTYREGGVKALYSGYGITVCRAFPANATVFAVYEATSRQWKKHFHADA